MKIADLINKDLVDINLKSHTSEGVIREIVDQFYKSRKIKDKKHVLESLLKRERLGTTGTGDGIAIPHARVAELKAGLIFIGISKQGIDFSSIDKKPVHLVVLFLTPLVESETHLKIISKLAVLLDNKVFIRQLLNCSTNEELYRTLQHGGVEKDGFLALSKEEIYLELASSDNGISEFSAKKRLEVYGANKLKAVKKTLLIIRFLSHLTNLLAVMMWFCSVLCFWAQMPEAGWACIAVVFINAVFSFWQEFKAEKAIEALSKLIPSNARLIREGEERLVSTSEIVPGDIIMLEEGDNVPADARLIEAHELRLNNSAFSGESKLSYKFSEEFHDGKDFLWLEMPNLVFAGTSVASGMGKAVVIATGMGTEIGKIAYLTQTVKEDLSPLQKEVNRIGRLIAFISVVIGFVFFFAGLFFTKLTVFASGMFAIGIITANVPQGLMPTLTLALAMAVQRMAKRKALIKKLSSVETLGCTNVICTDKTGTLTTNQMSVRKIWINDKVIEVSGSGYEPVGEFTFKDSTLLKNEIRTVAFDQLMHTCALCNTAKLNPPTEIAKYWSVIGDPTEAALLTLMKKAGYDADQERPKYHVLKRFPFESIRKRMSSVHTLSDGYTYTFVKGSPKEILELSVKVMIGNDAVDLTEKKRLEISAYIDGFAEEGLRVLGLAFCKIDPKDISEATAQSVEKDLVFIGATGMYDPPRPEVKEAISVCKKAGIRVVMITGDYQVTALSIAKQVGIISSQNYEVITGTDLVHLTDEQLKEKILNKEIIFARANPEHKLRVVNTFKELGNIVAVTGDGVNDAPALKRSDIGVAMGLRGTDVAKESAEMVLLDDNFASIVSAIEEGRAVFDNIKKFITYIFAHLVPEGIPFIFYVLLKIPMPITVLQILAIDLGTEIFPALALGAEKPEPGIMQLPPRPKNKGVIDKIVLFRGYIILGLLSASATLGAYYFILFQGGWKPGMQLEPNDTTFTNPLHLKAITVLFVGIIVMQIANVFNCRSEKYSTFRIGFFSNMRIFWSIAISFVFTCILIYVPFFQKIFNTTGLGLSDWCILFLFMSLIFILEELRKRFFNFS
ncbi:MAG: HAD-IC family P-type ATPase [Candidatus Omnitrophica bacterium]|nr:HAD-IC family P-type ATPase [Candidatus Omnitrophota bacterium]